jgi:hypothetical protein
VVASTHPQIFKERALVSYNCPVGDNCILGKYSCNQNKSYVCQTFPGTSVCPAYNKLTLYEDCNGKQRNGVPIMCDERSTGTGKCNYYCDQYKVLSQTICNGGPEGNDAVYVEKFQLDPNQICPIFVSQYQYKMCKPEKVCASTGFRQTSCVYPN